MKKTKQIDTYYCDYCGKECEHTPELIMPEIECIQLFQTNENSPLRFMTAQEIYFHSKDICPECLRKISVLLTQIDKVKSKDGSVCIKI